MNGIEKTRKNTAIQIKSYGGRLIESSKPKGGKNGLVGEIDVLPLNINGNKIECVQADINGQSVLFSDTSGNVFLAHIKKNRFCTIARNLRPLTLQFLDHNYITFAIASRDRQVYIYNQSGQKLDELKGHKSKVFQIEVNFLRETFVTISKDVIILWDLKNFREIRSLFPKSGNQFIYAQFSNDCDFLVTRLENGLAYFWNLTTLEMEKQIFLGKEYDHCYILHDDDSIFRGQTLIIDSSGKMKNFEHLIQSTSELSVFELPYKNKSILKLRSLARTKIATILVDDGRIFFIDPERNYSVIHELKNTKKGFIDFSLDGCQEYIYCLTSEGLLQIYHIKQMLEAGMQEIQRKLQNGNSLESIQTILNLVERKPFECQIKENLYRERQEEELQKIDAFKGFESIRSNFVVENFEKPFNLKNLRFFLKKHGVYPDKHRATIWSYLLNLPNNFALYNAYLQKGDHKALSNFSEQFPLKSETLTQKMTRIMSILGHYSPIFCNLHVTPNVIFPFVKLFSKDEALALEVSITFFLHWNQHIFEDYPNPSAKASLYVFILVQMLSVNACLLRKTLKSSTIFVTWAFLLQSLSTPQCQTSIQT